MPDRQQPIMIAEEELQDSCNKDKICAESSQNSAVGNECLEAGKGWDKGVNVLKSETISSEVARSAFKIYEAKENKSDHTKCYTYLKQKVWIERVVLISICVAVAGGFTVPIIIYAVDTDRGDNSTISFDLDVDNCQISTSDVQENVSTQSLYNDQCVQYDGVCAQYLSQLNNGTSLSSLTLIGPSEDDVNDFIGFIKQYASQQCQDAALPFLCQYIFPPCDVSDGNVDFIGRTQCINIRDAICSFEWNFVLKTPSASLLPNCENFNDDNNDGDNVSLIVPQSLQCQYQFKEYCGLCLPLCGKFSQYRVETKFQERSIIIFSGAAAFIGGILVFIASIYRWRAMFEFPSVLVIYNTMCAFVIACFVLIPYIGGQERLFCTHEALNVAVDNPSAFCQAGGVVYHWGLLLLATFWLLHLIHLFIKIFLPIWSRKLDRKQTKITLHVTEATGAFILCGLAPIIFVSVSEYSFGRFPPVLCFPSRKVNFYTICLPLCVMIGSGVILTILMFWNLHKRQLLFEKRKSKYLRYFISFSVPEVKILILSCYFIIFGIMALINLSISIRDSDVIVDKLLNYFACQARGYSASNTCYTEYEELDSYLKPELNSATFFILGLVPWSNLLFAVQVSDIKKAIFKIACIYSSRGSQNITYSTTSNTK